MKYCKKCLMTDLRPGIKFDENGVCSACNNFEKQKYTDWDARLEELRAVCDKYRGCNGKSYDCAVAASGGKDSIYQLYYIKEVMKMNPVLLSVGNYDWTDTGRKNLENIAEAFSVDLLYLQPNTRISKLMARKTFEEMGSPAWYIDALIYAFPYRMAAQMGLKLLVYGENINYTYGGKYDKETPSARMQMANDVVKPIWGKLLEDGCVTEEEMDSARMMTLDEYDAAGMEAIYMSYYTPWDAHHNYEVAKRFGFRHLDHEHMREGTLENYNHIDSSAYALSGWIKYIKFGHAAATEMACRWIRAGHVTREEMIPLVKKHDKKLDQSIIDGYLSYTGMTPREFWKTMDKWYNRDIFYQDRDGVWHEKFEVGVGMVDGKRSVLF